MDKTPFSSMCNILAEVYLTDEYDLLSHYNVGLPAAYLIAEGLVTPNDDVIVYIEQTWDALLDAVGVDDAGFDSLEDLTN